MTFLYTTNRQKSQMYFMTQKILQNKNHSTYYDFYFRHSLGIPKDFMEVKIGILSTVE